MFDEYGQRFLDCYNNVAHVGHSHPKVVEAIARQAATLNTHTRYLHEGIVRYAEELLSTLPHELGHVMFTCTGSEAGDLALRIAKHYYLGIPCHFIVADRTGVGDDPRRSAVVAAQILDRKSVV